MRISARLRWRLFCRSECFFIWEDLRNVNVFG